MFQTKFVEKIKTYILCCVIFFFYRAVFEIICKNYCAAGQAKDENMGHARCMLDNYG